MAAQPCPIQAHFPYICPKNPASEYSPSRSLRYRPIDSHRIIPSHAATMRIHSSAPNLTRRLPFLCCPLVPLQHSPFFRAKPRPNPYIPPRWYLAHVTLFAATSRYHTTAFYIPQTPLALASTAGPKRTLAVKFSALSSQLPAERQRSCRPCSRPFKCRNRTSNAIIWVT